MEDPRAGGGCNVTDVVSGESRKRRWLKRGCPGVVSYGSFGALSFILDNF